MTMPSKTRPVGGTDDAQSAEPAEPDPFGRALAILSATPTILPPLVEAIGSGLLDWRPAPDEWSVREILGHLLYVERLLDDRIGRMAEGPGRIDMPPGPPAPAPGPADETLEAWLVARRASLMRLHGLRPEQLARIGVHRRYGPITVGEHVVEWAYHDLEHIRQLAAVVEAALYPAIGGWRGLYPPPLGERPQP
jgi:hypothetical protein